MSDLNNVYIMNDNILFFKVKFIFLIFSVQNLGDTFLSSTRPFVF